MRDRSCYFLIPDRPRPVTDAKGCGLGREVWPGQEVPRRGGAFGRRVAERSERKEEQKIGVWKCSLSKRARDSERGTKDRCVEMFALEACS